MNEVAMLYRAMQPELDGYPKCGDFARTLGVRIEGKYVDITPNEEGYVQPGQGGMSVVGELEKSLESSSSSKAAVIRRNREGPDL